jgi:hypothetical protein
VDHAADKVDDVPLLRAGSAHAYPALAAIRFALIRLAGYMSVMSLTCTT